MHWPLFLMKSQLVCASEFLKTKFFAMPLMPKSNIHRVYNCLQLNRFTPPYENRSVQNKIAIIVANLEPPKDHESLLMAWKKVVKKEPEAMLWVVGRGSLQKYLENICIQLNIKNNVIFFGQRDDVPQLLWQSKIFVFTSKSEGFGTVLLEALAAGLKIIAFDEPAAREVLNNGKWGQLIPNRDIELFANAIIKEFKNEHVTIDKEKINKYLENFSVDNMIQGYLNILKAD